MKRRVGAWKWLEADGLKAEASTTDFFERSQSRTRSSLVAQTVKTLLAMQETWVQPLGWEDPLEKKMETHSSILAWRITWTEDPGGLQCMKSQRVGRV